MVVGCAFSLGFEGAAENWMNSAIEMAQRLGCPAFDNALQKFLKGAGELEWKARKGGALASAIVFDGAGEWWWRAVELGVDMRMSGVWCRVWSMHDAIGSIGNTSVVQLLVVWSSDSIDGSDNFDSAPCSH